MRGESLSRLILPPACFSSFLAAPALRRSQALAGASSLFGSPLRPLLVLVSLASTNNNKCVGAMAELHGYRLFPWDGAVGRLAVLADRRQLGQST